MARQVEQTEGANALSNAVRSWVMISLTSIFVVLYASALVGWLKPLADEKVVLRLEPIIFVIIGYFFGRLPSQENENSLKSEINRHASKADAAQYSKEQAQQVTEALEEKVKNAKAILTSDGPRFTAKGFVGGSDKAELSTKEGVLRQSVLA